MLKHIRDWVAVICVNDAITLISIHAASSNYVPKVIVQHRAQSEGSSRAVRICI